MGRLKIDWFFPVKFLVNSNAYNVEKVERWGVRMRNCAMKSPWKNIITISYFPRALQRASRKSAVEENLRVWKNIRLIYILSRASCQNPLKAYIFPYSLVVLAKNISF